MSMGILQTRILKGLPFLGDLPNPGDLPPPGDLPNPEIEARSSTLQVDSLPSEPPGKKVAPWNKGDVVNEVNTDLKRNSDIHWKEWESSYYFGREKSNVILKGSWNCFQREKIKDFKSELKFKILEHLLYISVDYRGSDFCHHFLSSLDIQIHIFIPTFYYYLFYLSFYFFGCARP